MPKESLEDFDFATSDCSVCTNGFQGGDNLRLLPCGHVFHVECTSLWLSEHASCPHCKAPFKFARDFKLKALENQVQRSSDESIALSGSIYDDTQPMPNPNSSDNAVEIHIPPPVVDGS
jgi:hypothetical protein